MFLNQKVLTKMMKDAYKIRLKVGYLNGGIILIGGTWAVWMDGEHVPNKIKALIIELSGELPEKGKLFGISKDNPEAQFEIVTEEIQRIFEGVEEAESKLHTTPIVLDLWKPIRILQTANDLHNIVEINDTYFHLIDKSEVDLDIEGEPTGPCYGSDPYSAIYWYNDICLVMVMPIKQRFNSLFRNLSEITLDDEVMKDA